MKKETPAIENLYTKDCIRTRSGIYVNVFEPKPEMFTIEDIAHALSHQPRFGGHLPKFYSVAQHSWLCSKLVTRTHALAALLHDSSEAFLCDIPSPIKKRMPEYKIVENSVMDIIAAKFCFHWPMHEEVEKADKEMLELEWRALMLEMPIAEFQCWGPCEAKEHFLKEYKLLTN